MTSKRKSSKSPQLKSRLSALSPEEKEALRAKLGESLPAKPASRKVPPSPPPETPEEKKAREEAQSSLLARLTGAKPARDAQTEADTANVHGVPAKYDPATEHEE